ncbi:MULTISPECIES: hypothetical protein [unclassified Chryseobacterium]|uniref:hypothetical protein n=1 Tax=unclassified Chryseobacterium TaxID=2593645 RepID=UPI000B0B2E07|nr:MULTISPECIES: hypothetical protein [unclassified Chryseobacterium]
MSIYTYKITTFKQSRILRCLFLLPLSVIIALVISAEINSLLIIIPIFAITLFLMYYYSVGKLQIVIENEKILVFIWSRKNFFNYKKLPSVQIKDIRTIVLDNGEFLKKIRTENQTIYINNSKIDRKNIKKLILKLQEITKNENLKIIDSWDEVAEKGLIKIAYKINLLILLFSTVVIIIFSILKELNPASFAVFLLIIPQIILYHKQMKNKLDK